MDEKRNWILMKGDSIRYLLGIRVTQTCAQGMNQDFTPVSGMREGAYLFSRNHELCSFRLLSYSSDSIDCKTWTGTSDCNDSPRLHLCMPGGCEVCLALAREIVKMTSPIVPFTVTNE